MYLVCLDTYSLEAGDVGKYRTPVARFPYNTFEEAEARRIELIIELISDHSEWPNARLFYIAECVQGPTIWPRPEPLLDPVFPVLGTFEVIVGGKDTLRTLHFNIIADQIMGSDSGGKTVWRPGVVPQVESIDHECIAYAINEGGDYFGKFSAEDGITPMRWFVVDSYLPLLRQHGIID
jgi:hypothetical protein